MSNKTYNPTSTNSEEIDYLELVLLLKQGRKHTISFMANFLAPIVQTLDNAIQHINHYPVDKWWQNKPRYPLDSDLCSG